MKNPRSSSSVTNKIRNIHGAPSWEIESDSVKLAVTEQGGHMAPASFNLGGRWVSPYSLAPWQPHEADASLPPILKILRGDFFCLPFAGAESMPIHGDSANSEWQLSSIEHGSILLTLHSKAPEAIVKKSIQVFDGEAAIYQSHEIKDLKGVYPLGYHAILDFSSCTKPAHIRTSPIRFGMTQPDFLGNPEIGEYTSLKPGRSFKSLSDVQKIDGSRTDLSEYPARPGFEDLAMVSSKSGDFAWTAVTFDDFAWVSLKDPRALPSTLFWISNGGRHMPPWNGKHRQRMGIEEVNSAFALGTEASAKCKHVPQGIPTAHKFSKKTSAFFKSIHLAFPVGQDFGGVKKIARDLNGHSILVKSETGASLNVPVKWKLLYD